MPDQVFRLHLLAIAVLFAGHLTVHAADQFFGHGSLLGLTARLNFVDETSLPNFLSAVALLATAALSAAVVRVWVVRQDQHMTASWTIATLVLCFLAIDEGAGLHDLLAVPVQRETGGSGVFFIGWVLPYAIIAIGTSYKLLMLAVSLPTTTRTAS